MQRLHMPMGFEIPPGDSLAVSGRVSFRKAFRNSLIFLELQSAENNARGFTRGPGSGMSFATQDCLLGDDAHLTRPQVGRVQ